MKKYCDRIDSFVVLNEYKQINNLDFVKLISDENYDLKVENEHGTRYDESELTIEELNLFLWKGVEPEVPVVVNINKYLPYCFKITVGDYWGDGHGKHEDYLIKSNKSSVEVQDAYAKSNLLFGMDYCRDLFSDYQDSQIDLKNYSKLSKHLDMTKYVVEEKIGNTIVYDFGDEHPLLATKLLLDYIKVSLFDFEYEFVFAERAFSFGYGFFC